jgi:hypothetical protein
MTAFSRFIEEHGRTLHFIAVALGAIAAVSIYLVNAESFRFVHLIFLIPFGGVAGFGVLQVVVLLTGITLAMPRLALSVVAFAACATLLYMLLPL